MGSSAMRGVPVSAEVLKRYGVSTTPTLALVDREGIVQLYRPGQMTEEDLDARGSEAALNARGSGRASLRQSCS